MSCILSIKEQHHVPVFREIVIGGQPFTSSQKKVERKRALKKLLENEIGKDLQKIQKKCETAKLLLDVTFRVIESQETGRSKMDLDNLLKILLDVLSINMVNGQEPQLGLGIVPSDSQIYEIRCRKMPVTSETDQGISLRISTFNKINSVSL